MRPRMPRNGGGGDRGRGVMLLLMLLRNINDMDRKPPLTLGLMGLMCSLHFQKMISPGQFKRFSLCPDKVLYKMELSRIGMSALLHVDDVHVYHNMISFLWKGYHLEHRFGWLRFGLVIVYLLLLCHSLVVALAFVLDKVIGMRGYLRQCSIGFSGVLFALKVLLNHGLPAFSNVYGFQVPTKYAAWLELVVIHMIVPRASFIGHMCGILADKRVIDPIADTISRRWQAAMQPPAVPRNFGSGTAQSPRGEATDFTSDEVLARQLQEEENRRATSNVRERFERYEQLNRTLPEQAPEISAEELRRRRVMRFQNA